MKTTWTALLLMLPLLGGCQATSPSPGQATAAASASPSAAQTFHRDPTTGLAALPALGTTPLEVKAYWEPMEGLPQFLTEPEFGKSIAKLKPEPSRTYKSSDFLVFLPATAVQLGAPFPIPSDAVAVGTTWALPQTAVARFIKQFHPSATADLPIDASGAYAILRARSESRWEIDFRAHVQLEVAENVLMTPSQFQGRLLVNIAEGKIEAVEVVVPQLEGQPNVAMDAFRGDNLAGVGRLPRMELVGGDAKLLDATAWLDELPRQEAQKLLSQQFYAFQAVEWLPLPAALERAEAENKPLLAVVIAGPLDDQAC